MQRDEGLILRILKLVEDCERRVLRITSEKINAETGEWPKDKFGQYEQIEYHIEMLVDDGYLRRHTHRCTTPGITCDLGDDHSLTMMGHDWLDSYRHDLYERYNRD